MKTICVLPGDGIGPEVIGCAVEVMSAVTPDLRLVHSDIGATAADRHGDPLPPETIETMRTADSCLFGAVTSSAAKNSRSAVLTFRKELGLFANVRPVRTMTPMTGRSPIDVVIVRENSEGLYTQDETHEDDGVTTRRRVTSAACRRICEFAISQALHREKGIVAYKANVRESDGLFLRTFGKMTAADDSPHQTSWSTPRH
jgi:isocitrate/isopropylmalate dehydrogenase